MGKWIPKSEILLTRRKNLVWCTNTLRAIEAAKHSDMVEETLEFLDDVIEVTTDVYQGHLSIDMDMANAKDIDDGQTVTGMLDEMQEREQQLEDAIVEIEARENKPWPSRKRQQQRYKRNWMPFNARQHINWQFLRKHPRTTR